MAIAVPTTASDNAVMGPGNSTSRTVTKFANCTDGDILIAAIAHEANRAITPPAGWTQIASGSAGGTIWLTIYWKRASSEGANWTFSFDAFMWNEIAIFRVTGCLASGDVIDGTPSTNGTTGSTATWNSVTTTAANSAAFCIGGVVNDGTNWSSWSNSFSEVYDNSKTGIAWKIQASAGAVGSTTASIGSGAHAAIMFALKDAAGGGTTFTGSGTPSLPALTLDGDGAFTAPVYTGSGTPGLPALALAGLGTFDDGVFSGTGSLAFPAPALAGIATFAAPVYAGQGVLALAPLALAGAATFDAPVYDGDGALALPALSLSGAGDFAGEIYTGTGALALAALLLSGAGASSAEGFRALVSRIHNAIGIRL